MTVDRCIGSESAVVIETTGTSTNTITDAYNFYSSGYVDAAAGNTNSITNMYGFYHGSSHGTNNYAFYDATNSLSVFGDIQTQAVSITDNLITTNRSNDDLNIEANGTGQVQIGGVTLDTSTVSSSDGGKINLNSLLSDSTYSNYFGSTGRIKGTALVYEDLAVNPNDLTDREIGHAIFQGTRLTASSTNANFRPRNVVMGSGLDLDGFSYTNTSLFRGPLGAQLNGLVQNSSATNATCNVVRGIETSAGVSEFTGSAGDINIVDNIGNFASNYFERDGSGDVNVTNSYSFYAKNDAYPSGGTGTFNATNVYGYYYEAASGFDTLTNEYAFYDASNSLSRFGAVILANQAGDPSGVTDSAHIYAKDDAGSSEVYVRDEAGNVTKISPHNAAGEWEYYSKNSKTGKTVRINMEKLVAEVEKLSGKSFIESE
jgi:hypothetical protein